ncbi:LuxR C-terminal-related transcriptional regulator [Nocardioides sp. BP30]|uniref:helix-turn-helix transcriptional regulator n=1 Tax=Nocardioides sp. BP30 TaxID=3036374 RepID=UPI0024699913|nr:LuxR C-terminal-related transcriptional regulator [Nocardioides sp. BP30]WGL50613.1 LuxR C-terminal-related transcriptional regulator [Nocardioides sp. BP30]
MPRPPLASLTDVASTGAPLAERAQRLVDGLTRWLPPGATWLALADPDAKVYATVASTGLEQPVLDYLARPAVAESIRDAGLTRNRPPLSLADLAVPVDELPTWTDCLIPTGFREGLGVPLFEPGGPYLGILTLLFFSGDPPSPAVRATMARLAPLVAGGVSPMRSVLATARLVQGATSGAVLFRDGTLQPLPGLERHELLDARCPVVEVARDALLAGQVYRSFMWPVDDGGAGGHVRMTVLAAADVPAFVLGTLLVSPDGDCRGLTSRELEVLGHIVDGLSNQQVARRLALAPRTVAAHVEHILHKLDAPSRTLAAVQAERDGCYVPAPRSPIRH